MIEKISKEINNMSNLLYGILVISVEIAICSLVVTIMTVSMNDDLTKEVINLKYENTELKWELDQVDQMICNNEVQNDKTETN